MYRSCKLSLWAIKVAVAVPNDVWEQADMMSVYNYLRRSKNLVIPDCEFLRGLVNLFENTS